MKKILACTLAVCMLLVSLTSCGYDEIELIWEEIFDEYLLSFPAESEENVVTKGNKPDEDELDEDETDTGEIGTDESDKNETDTGEIGTDESDKDETDTNETVPEQCPFEWIAYEEGHYMKMLCNCCAVADFIDPHVDEDYDNSCDVCGYPVKSDECPFEWIAYEEGHYKKMLCNCCEAPAVIDPHENWDADMYCDVCGYYMGPTPTNYFLRNQAGCEWMNEISAEDITEIKIISEAVGVAPGALKTITSSKDKAAITTVFDQYYWLDTWPIPQEEGQIDGGGAVTVKFILNNGTEKVLYFNNGNYLDTHGNYFELLYTPKFSKETAFRSYFGFVNYQEMGVVWEYDDSCEPYDICEIPVDEFEFEYGVEVEVDLGEIEPYNMEVGTSFGTLKFLTPDVFFIKGVCCMLVGADLDELILRYATVAPPENYFLRNQAGCEWMNELTSDDIAEIKIISRDGMTGPGCFKYISSSTDKSTISRMFDQYYWLDMWPVDEEESIVCDGGVITAQFILNDGTTRELEFNNGEFFVDSRGNHFKLLYLPNFQDTPEYISYYAFETDTGIGTIGQLLGGSNLAVEPIWLCEIPMDEIEFAEVEIDFGVSAPVPTHIIETEFGYLMFIDHSIFYISGESGYYYLVGKNLDDLIDQYCEIAS